MSKFFKYVEHFSCIFCSRDFPLTDTTFRSMNRHGWGCCAECWEKGEPNKVARPGEIIRYDFA